MFLGTIKNYFKISKVLANMKLFTILDTQIKIN